MVVITEASSNDSAQANGTVRVAPLNADPPLASPDAGSDSAIIVQSTETTNRYVLIKNLQAKSLGNVKLIL